MKTTIVPAQITTVEDKVTAHLSFTQLLLLMTPVFLGGATFVFLPPFANYALYKLFIALFVALICITLAIRIRGRLILEWIGILSRYNLRPQHYVFDKNTTYFRNIPKRAEEAAEAKEVIVTSKIKKQQTKPFRMKNAVAIESAMADPDSEFHFKVNKNGGLSVNLKEIN